jgi:tetrapyrrole methylase family protein/MazG family protein
MMHTGKKLEDLTTLVETLRGPNGCPWDREQTLSDLKSFLMGEAYELLEAMGGGNHLHIREEAGDLLFIILFIVDLFREKGTFTIYDVIGEVKDKMIRRHPHVFADAPLDTAQEVKDKWHALKEQEGKPPKGPSILDGVAEFLPALVQAQQLTQRAARVGFDWENPSQVIEKIDEELQELKESIDAKDQKAIADEMGDLLFAAVNLARSLAVDAEQALRGINHKFVRRFHCIEEAARAAGRSLEEMSLSEMDALWEKAKKVYP